MRVLIAPDKFAGTLSATQAAEAIAVGWRQRCPDDILDLAPMSDGGPGFVEVIHTAMGGKLFEVSVEGPYGDPTPAAFLREGSTAFIESAHACGLYLTRRGDPERASTYGVGQLLTAAVRSGASKVVVGLGGSGTTDGGAGLLAALGAEPNAALRQGSIGLAGLDFVTIPDQVGAEIVIATDVENPLTGLFGAAKTYGPQKGIGEERLPVVDRVLEHFAACTDRRLALDKGAGAAGGLGFGLMLLGATRQPGIDLVSDLVDLPARARLADLIITGEGAFDFSSSSGKVPYGVAAIAANALSPCIALAGQVHIGSREMRALGIEAAYSLVDLVGEERSMLDSAAALSELGYRTARTWSWE
jgi:glycerate 2-kinase